jgi:hypothetical protein
MMLPGSMIWNSSIHQYPKEGPQPRTRAGNQPLARKVPPQVTERTLRANRPAATPAMPGRSRGKRATLKISDFYGHFCLRDLAILCRLSRSTNIINRIIESPSSPERISTSPLFSCSPGRGCGPAHPPHRSLVSIPRRRTTSTRTKIPANTQDFQLGSRNGIRIPDNTLPQTSTGLDQVLQSRDNFLPSARL